MALIKCLAQARIYRIDQESQCIQRIPVVRIFETSQERENGPPSLSQWSHQVQKDDHRNVVCTYFTGHNLRSQQYLQPLYANFFITMSIICFILIIIDCTLSTILLMMFHNILILQKYQLIDKKRGKKNKEKIDYGWRASYVWYTMPYLAQKFSSCCRYFVCFRLVVNFVIRDCIFICISQNR